MYSLADPMRCFLPSFFHRYSLYVADDVLYSLDAHQHRRAVLIMSRACFNDALRVGAGVNSCFDLKSLYVFLLSVIFFRYSIFTISRVDRTPACKSGRKL